MRVIMEPQSPPWVTVGARGVRSGVVGGPFGHGASIGFGGWGGGSDGPYWLYPSFCMSLWHVSAYWARPKPFSFVPSEKA